ncbi:hypothetical protein Lfu02_69460 [Longispora fulva]|uniref:Uncharacterized protein n=1 Tax=Longispora fulva TaxID=619741 RepID=A0A8J7G7T6_9ACTN|nr:hypothetical protein [Longispora fulva]MBG6134515.1 hypothetical protein [Longispora fulva]GIG62574.1 hypothetical protein Lfu02_69460 [Longispora fulva]
MVDERRLSDAVAQPIIAAYRAGGFALALLVLGALLMLSGATLASGVFGYVIVILGFVLVIAPCYFFYVREIRPLTRAQAAGEQSREMLDTIQDVAVMMTELTLQYQALAFKHADKVASAIETVRPIVRSIGFLNKVADHPAVVSTDNLARSIVRVTGNARDVLDDVHAALIASDPTELRKYLAKLQSLKARTVEVLAAADSAR